MAATRARSPASPSPVTLAASTFTAAGRPDNVVEETLGTDAAGDTGLGNTAVGVTIYAGATDNTVGGNTTGDGAELSSRATSAESVSRIRGPRGTWWRGTSYIGTDAAGDPGLGNAIDGVQILSGISDNTIGGTDFWSWQHDLRQRGRRGWPQRPWDIGQPRRRQPICDNGDAGVALFRQRLPAPERRRRPSGNAIGGSSSAYGNTITGNGGAAHLRLWQRDHKQPVRGQHNLCGQHRRRRRHHRQQRRRSQRQHHRRVLHQQDGNTITGNGGADIKSTAAGR